ncbi:hypothetical protein BC629DRAFT_436102 [Irpex lacteus]|nr:hypothetical protein BC629DRAFT_436102 [Irpex lacteus]
MAVSRDWGRRLDYLHPTYLVAVSLVAALFNWKAVSTKSPEEHIVEAWWTSTLDPTSRTQKVSNKWFRPVFHPPAYRCVRVKLFSGDISRMMDDVCLFSDFYLDEGGNLNLNRVRKTWNLDRIQAVVYSSEKGLRLFMLDSMDVMPARHVDALKGRDGCIRIIEVPSQSTIKLRDHRARLVGLLPRMPSVWHTWVVFVFMVLTWLVYFWYYGAWQSAASVFQGYSRELWSSPLICFPKKYSWKSL